MRARLSIKCNAGGRCHGRSFCENGSKCVKPGPFCECTEGFTGLRCEQVLCRPPCQNGGVCGTNNTCACPQNTMGEQCEVLPTQAPTKAPGGGGFRDIKVKTYDISSPEFWSQELGGGLYGWSVAVIFFAFIRAVRVVVGGGRMLAEAFHCGSGGQAVVE
jgi:hypothetical protein